MGECNMSKTNRPNIVLVMADDMGFSDIGCYGSEIRTPNIDRLAKDGIRFSQMYNCARCCPTRASLLTGLYPHQAGVGLMVGNMGTRSYQGYLRDDCVTIAQVLKEAGYSTGMSGKWHVGGSYSVASCKFDTCTAGDLVHPTPLQRGFDRFYGILEGASNYYNPHTLMDGDKAIKAGPDEEYYFTDAISEKAVDMINDFSKEDPPFFMYVAYTAPHWPLHALPEDIEKYRGKYLEGWDKIREERYKKLIQEGIIKDTWEISPRDVSSKPWGEAENKEWEDMRMAVYAAQIDRMDQGICRITDALSKNGRLENTLFMFLSDNGGCAELLHEDGWIRDYVSPMRTGEPVIPGNDPKRLPGTEDTYMSYDLPWANASNSPFRYFKRWVHEGGIATPFIVYWPEGLGEKQGIVHEPFHVIDIMESCIEAAGIQYPLNYKGKDITPTPGISFFKSIKDKEWKREKPIFWEHEGNCAVRLGKYKLVRQYPNNWELYDMEKDRTELNNIIGENKELSEKMTAMYEKWSRECGVIDWQDMIDIMNKIRKK